MSFLQARIQRASQKAQKAASRGSRPTIAPAHAPHLQRALLVVGEGDASRSALAIRVTHLALRLVHLVAELVMTHAEFLHLFRTESVHLLVERGVALDRAQLHPPRHRHHDEDEVDAQGEDERDAEFVSGPCLLQLFFCTKHCSTPSSEGKPFPRVSDDCIRPRIHQGNIQKVTKESIKKMGFSQVSVPLSMTRVKEQLKMRFSSFFAFSRLPHAPYLLAPSHP